MVHDGKREGIHHDSKGEDLINCVKKIIVRILCVYNKDIAQIWYSPKTYPRDDIGSLGEKNTLPEPSTLQQAHLSAKPGTLRQLR